MKNQEISIHLTRHSLLQIKLLLQSDSQLLLVLEKEILAFLRSHPAAGHLLLNRTASSREAKRLIEQLCERYPYGEIREFSTHHVQVVYLLHQSQIYLLSCLYFQQGVPDLWRMSER